MHAITPSGYSARFTSPTAARSKSTRSSSPIGQFRRPHGQTRRRGSEWTTASALPKGWYAAGGAAYIAFGGARLTTGRWDAAVAQGQHVARTILHDCLGAEDPGPHRPTTGFTVSAFGSTITGRGLRRPYGTERTSAWPIDQPRPDAMLTEFVGADGR